jgi:NADH dehydrogenase/NADH:ubiquinone oxidoreductase subunit G
MLKKFFIICSGADSQILENCSIGEQNKYAGIGATVFFTAVLAFFAASYALYTVFDNLYSSIFFGLIWGLLIFNLDRYIVSTIKKTGHVVDELIQASPRILLAVIIAIVISKPLELKIFEKEINQVLLEQKNEMTLANKTQLAEQYSPTITSLQNEISNLKNDINIKEAAVNTLYNTYIAEAEGTAGTKLLGKGPVYKEKREKHDALLAELQQLKTDNKEKITALENDIVNLKGDFDSQVATTQPIINNFDGLMARVNALGKLPWLPSFFIFMLFLAIETSPIFAKLLSPKGAYDFKLEDQESALKNNVLQNKHQREALLKTDYAINNRIYSDIEQEDELYTYKRKKARELMQLQADAFYKKQKTIL